MNAALSLVVHRGKSQTGRPGECSFKSHCAQRKVLCTEESHTQENRMCAALSLIVHRGKSQRGR